MMRRMMLALTVMLTTLAGTGVAFAQTAAPLDQSEQMAMSDTLQYALENNPTKEVSDWVNPDTGHSGAVVPVKTYTNDLGQPCREFVTTIVIGGQEEQGYGTACRQPDGSWQIVSDEQPTATPQAPTNVYVYAPPERYYYIYPDAYYYYPSSFYYPYHIYLSFDYVFRSGYLHFGTYYLDGPRFRHRYPVYVHSRVYFGPRIFSRYPWYYKSHEHYRSHARPPVYHRQYPRHEKRYDYRHLNTDRTKTRERFDNRRQWNVRTPDRNRLFQQRSPAVRQPALKQERRSPTGRDRTNIDRPRQYRRTNPQRQHNFRQGSSNRRSAVERTRRSPVTRDRVSAERGRGYQNADSHARVGKAQGRSTSSHTRSQRSAGHFDGGNRRR